MSLTRASIKKRFGPYRFLPGFFIFGAVLELFMIKVRIGKETFYDTALRRASERRLQELKETEASEEVTEAEAVPTEVES